MNLPRILAATILCLGLGLYLTRVVLRGLISGEVRHTDSSRVCRKLSNPLGYWALIVLFSLSAAGLISVWAKVVYESIFRVAGGA